MRRALFALIRKDLLIEARGREALIAMIVFAVMTIVMFNFALRLRADTVKPLAPGVLWVTIVFAGTLGLNRSMAIEQLHQAIDGLMLAPHDHSLIFIGKAVSNALFMLIMSCFALPVVAIMFDERLVNVGVFMTIITGVVSYAGAGTLIAAIAISTRSREVFLPILLLPVALPMIIAAVLVSAGFTDQANLADFGAWYGMLFAFGLIFWTAGLMLFDVIVEG
jgi:heme exporter protein B